MSKTTNADSGIDYTEGGDCGVMTKGKNENNEGEESCLRGFNFDHLTRCKYAKKDKTRCNYNY